MHKPHQESTSKRSYKCQGLGHIASKCPNQKVVALIEEYEAKEEDVEEVVKSNHVQEDETKSSLLSNFDLEIKNVLDVTTLVVEETESEKKFSQEVKPILEFVDVMSEEIQHGLSPMMNIKHHINLIPGLVFSNKLAFIMGPKEHEELKTQVDDLLDKRLVQESKSSYVVPTMLAHEKDECWRMCYDCQVFNNFLIHEKVKFNIGQRAEQ